MFEKKSRASVFLVLKSLFFTNRTKNSSGEPWLWRPDWKQGFSIARQWGQNTFLFFFGLFFVGLTSLISIVVFLDKAKASSDWRFALVLLPLSGLILLRRGYQGYRTIQDLGCGQLYFDKVGSLGGTFRATLLFNKVLSSDNSVFVRISNKRVTVQGTGDHSRYSEDLLWQQETKVHPIQSGRTSVLQLQFDIPYDTTPTYGFEPQIEVVQKLNRSLHFGFRSTSKDDQYITFRWDLQIEIPEIKQGYVLNFDLPVFKTAESRPDQTRDKLEGKENSEVKESELTAVKILEHKDKLRIGFLDQSRKSVGMVFFVIGAIFSIIASGALFVLSREGGFALLGLPIPLLFLVVGLGFVFAGMTTIFGNVIVQLSTEEMTIERKMMGFSWNSRIALLDINSVDMSEGMKQGDEVWYNIKVCTDRKLPHTIPALIKSKTEAQWLCDQIRSKLRKNAA